MRKYSEEEIYNISNRNYDVLLEKRLKENNFQNSRLTILKFDLELLLYAYNEYINIFKRKNISKSDEEYIEGLIEIQKDKMSKLKRKIKEREGEVWLEPKYRLQIVCWNQKN